MVTRNGGLVLTRGMVWVVLLLVLAPWWLTPTTLHAVAPEPVPEPVCASWSFGDASPTVDGAAIPVTVIVAACPDTQD